MTDMERALIGTALVYGKSIHDAEINPSDFHAPLHETVWRVMHAMATRNEPINPLTVWNKTESTVPPEDRRGLDAPWLHTVAEEGGVRTQIEYYAARVTDAATIRRVTNVGREILHLGENGMDAATLVERARKLVDDAATIDPADIRSMTETINETIDRLEEKARFTPTPWDDLNHLIGGWRPGALYVIGARPGSGKTVLGLQSALDLTTHGGVLFSSMEMPRHELQERAISQLAHVSTRDLERRTISDTGWAKISDARNNLDRSLYIDDRSMMTPTTIRSAARTVARKGKLVGIVIDYLQLMSSTDRNQKRHETVAEFSRQLKIMAKEFDVPVIALSQLNRASEGREGKLPSMADLRESGSLEQDADVVMLLHRDQDREDELKIAVAKNRHGMAGAVTLQFEGAYARITQRGWSPTAALDRRAS